MTPTTQAPLPTYEVEYLDLDLEEIELSSCPNTGDTEMTSYETAAKQNGTVTFEGREYALTSHADHTSRLLPGGYKNYNDASDGEAYDFELSAGAIDKDGNEYTVYWLFEGRKGEDDYELDSYDYSAADRVVER